MVRSSYVLCHAEKRAGKPCCCCLIWKVMVWQVVVFFVQSFHKNYQENGARRIHKLRHTQEDDTMIRCVPQRKLWFCMFVIFALKIFMGKNICLKQSMPEAFNCLILMHWDSYAMCYIIGCFAPLDKFIIGRQTQWCKVTGVKPQIPALIWVRQFYYQMQNRRRQQYPKSEFPSWIYTATISHKLIKALSPFQTFTIVYSGAERYSFPFPPSPSSCIAHLNGENGKFSIQTSASSQSRIIIWRGCIESAPRCKSLFLITSVSLSARRGINESIWIETKLDPNIYVRYVRTMGEKASYRRPELIKPARRW